MAATLTTTVPPAEAEEAAQLKLSTMFVENYPKLSREQAGHIRHIHNLVSQKDGEWSHMGALEAMQEFVDAYRYQLATMAYAVGAAHYHHMPALRSVFKTLHRQLIHKMLRREVWGYWFNTSMSGKRIDPHLTELRTPWADPVVRENIMYSGHLLLMVSMYAMLYDDDEFERDGAIKFEWSPLFWGMGDETFSYSTRTLQDAILREMERTDYMGVCCEPNMVFVVCNQFPIIGIRYNDVRHNTKEVDELLKKYMAAWDKKGGFAGPNGLFYSAWMERQNSLLMDFDAAFTAWGAAFMNSWNSDYVHSRYDGMSIGYITNTEKSGVRLNPVTVGRAFRSLVAEKGAPATAESTLDKAKEIARNEAKDKPTSGSILSKLTKPQFGYIVQWLSEMGKSEELNGLLKYADERLYQTWENGGLYYERNDEKMDKDLNWTHMDPYSGNAAIGYARLNVKDGQKKMYETPWTAETLKSRPWIDGVNLADGIDFLRGTWDEQHSCLVATMVTWDGSQKKAQLVFRNLAGGVWKVYRNGNEELSEGVEAGGSIEFPVLVDGTEVDLVVVKE